MRLQQAQGLVHDSVTLLGREAQQRQAADDEIERRIRAKLPVELERIGGNDVATRKTALEDLDELRVTLDEIEISRGHTAREQRRRNRSRACTELDDARGEPTSFAMSLASDLPLGAKAPIASGLRIQPLKKWPKSSGVWER